MVLNMFFMELLASLSNLPAKLVLAPYIFLRPATSRLLGLELGRMSVPSGLTRTFCLTPLTVLPPAVLGSERKNQSGKAKSSHSCLYLHVG
jgi:hypothetical protein